MQLHLKIIFCLFLLLLISNNKAFAYTPPIGIPDPGMWGTTHPIDSAAPSTATKCPGWPTNQTTNCYYINNSHAQATDTNNTFGYPSKPRLTIPSITYPAGAYIEITGGPYTTSVLATMNGTAENPIWLRGPSATAMPDMRAKLMIPNAKYTIIENLKFSNFKSVAINITGMAANNICIRNSKFQDLVCDNPDVCSTSVIGSSPTQDGSIHDLVIYNNLFQDIGDYLATNDQDFHAINVNLWNRKPPTTHYNVWSLNNTAIRIAGSLNQFNGDQRDAYAAANEVPPRPITNTNLQNFHHMYSGRNLMYQSRQALGAPKFTTDAIYSQNEVYNNYSISSGAGTGAVYQEGSRYVWILFNKFYDLTYGIRQSNTNFPGMLEADLRSYMIGNVIYNIHNKYNRTYSRDDGYKPNQAIGFESAAYKARYVVDNTFYQVGGGVNIGGQLIDDMTSINGNVFAGIYGIDQYARPDYHFSLISANGTLKTFLDRNFFQPRSDTGKVTFKFAGATPSSYMDSLAALQSSSVAQCKNCWTGDPMFVDAATYNLRPQAGSPLIGKNTRHPVYDEFQARYKLNIAYDFDGKPRPSGAWTIGAFEGGAATTLPAPQFKSINIIP